MNLILANQSLYYLSRNTLTRNMDEFYEICEKRAVPFTTMMSEKNYYFKHAGKEGEQGLRKVILEGRLNETSYIHFIRNATDLKELFKPSKCLYLGKYDPISFCEFEGSAHRFIHAGARE